MPKPHCLVLVLALILLAGSALAAPPRRSIPFTDSGPFEHVCGSGPHRQSTNLLAAARNAARAATAPPAVSRDEGDIAVIVDNGAILVPSPPDSPFDLPVPSVLTFAPTAGGGFELTTVAGGLDSDWGIDLELGDDASAEVPFTAGFPFQGVTYTSVRVHADGSVTLGEGEATVEGSQTVRDAALLIGGPPRLAPWLADLDPGAGGAVHADERSDHLVVTWAAVPEWSEEGPGPAGANTFQATLSSDGTIEFAYGEMSARFGVVGVAPGADQGPFHEPDLSAGAATFTAGAVFEEFAPQRERPFLDIFALSREFYKTHDDKYDFLVAFTDFPVDLGSAFAFNQFIKNETSGYGRFAFIGDLNDFFNTGSDGELEAFLHMNNIHLYWPDAGKMVDPPIKQFRFRCDALRAQFDLCENEQDPPGPEQLTQRARWFGTLNGDLGGFHGSYTLGLNSAMSAMAHETGHRWQAYPFFIHPTKGLSFDSSDLLGRQFGHWSFFFNVRVPDEQFGGDPRAASVEGNAIADLGPDASLGLPFPCTGPGESTFLTEPDELIDGYTRLDQYLMGVRLAEEVGTFWYVDEPRSPITGESLESLRFFLDATDDVTFCGKRVELTVDDLIAYGTATNDPRFGPRIPALGDEVDAVVDGEPVDVKTMAFILVVESDPGPDTDGVLRLDTFRRTWEEYANGPATGGRGRFDTRLAPAIH